MLIDTFELYFAYNQFMIFDTSVKLPGNDWTDEHIRQGFARRPSSINFSTLIDFGTANVIVYKGSYILDNSDERVIAVPFLCVSGKVRIEGPEEISPRIVKIEQGNYKLTVAQTVNRATEIIKVYFNKLDTPLERSEIIVSDEELSTVTQIVETAEIMEL
ncbi:MAG: hypothetical protein JSS81_03055 [Acidobacteria bacterium]|nr:hypothetical protein [Acidobacteriota bacterium]